jgi:hypothetical protein
MPSQLVSISAAQSPWSQAKPVFCVTHGLHAAGPVARK